MTDTGWKKKLFSRWDKDCFGMGDVIVPGKNIPCPNPMIEGMWFYEGQNRSPEEAREIFEKLGEPVPKELRNLSSDYKTTADTADG